MKCKTFECGCCGSGFLSTRREQAKHDQDQGYGICPECESRQNTRNEKQLESLKSMLRGALNEANRAAFDAMDSELQRAIVGEAIADGIIAWGPVQRNRKLSSVAL